MKTLAEQLNTAFKEKGWSIGDLLARTKFTCDRSSLSRKLHGKQKLSTKECETIARVLGATITIAWAPSGRRAS